MVVAMEGGVGGAIILTSAMALLLVGALSPAGASAPYPPEPAASGASWTNGQVLCQFGSTVPSVGVSALGSTDAGMTVSNLSIDELSPGGAIVATAHLAGAAWNVSNRSTDDAYDLAYTMHAPVMPASGTGPALGSVDLRVDFVLPAYGGSPDGPMNVVSVSFEIDNWSWQSASDHLALGFNASASAPTSEHLTATEAPGWLMVSTSNASGAELEQLGTNSTAAVSTPTALPAQVSANASVVLDSAVLARVTVAFGREVASYGSLAFTARIGVQLPSTVAGIPVLDLVGAAVAGVVVSAGVALAARRIRRKPSSLIYVEE